MGSMEQLRAAMASLESTLAHRPQELHDLLLVSPDRHTAALAAKATLDEVELNARQISPLTVERPLAQQQPLVPYVGAPWAGALPAARRADLDPEPEQVPAPWPGAPSPPSSTQRALQRGLLQSSSPEPAAASRSAEPQPVEVEDDLREWLRALRLEQYSGDFADLGAVLVEHVAFMTEDDVQGLPMRPLEHRRLLQAVYDLQLPEEVEHVAQQPGMAELAAAPPPAAPLSAATASLRAGLEVTLRSSRAADEGGSVMGLAVDASATITRTSGAAAQTPGLCVGNQIVNVNGAACRSGEDALAALRSASQAGADATLMMLVDPAVVEAVDSRRRHVRARVRAALQTAAASAAFHSSAENAHLVAAGPEPEPAAVRAETAEVAVKVAGDDGRAEVLEEGEPAEEAEPPLLAPSATLAPSASPPEHNQSEPPSAPEDAPAEQVADEAAQAFARFNLNGDGRLDREEVAAMLEEAEFTADTGYIDGLSGIFGTYDADGSGGIEIAEFRELWEQLELGERLAQGEAQQRAITSTQSAVAAAIAPQKWKAHTSSKKSVTKRIAAIEEPEPEPVPEHQSQTPANKAAIEILLSKVPLLQSLSEEERGRIAGVLVAGEAAPNVPIVSEGEAGDAMYFVREGEAAAIVDGRECMR